MKGCERRSETSGLVAGCLRRHCSMKSRACVSRPSGYSGSSNRIFSKSDSSSVSVARNGSLPVRAVYTTMPSAQMSIGGPKVSGAVAWSRPLL
jgi:hypothetical protein